MEGIQYRWLLVVVAHVGVMLVYALRVNLSVTLVAMVNSTYTPSTSHHERQSVCLSSAWNSTARRYAQPGSSPNGEGEFNWDNEQKGYILSSFFSTNHST